MNIFQGIFFFILHEIWKVTVMILYSTLPHEQIMDNI